MNEMLFYIGVSKTLPSGHKMVHGKQAQVMGPGTGDDAETALTMQFAGAEKGLKFIEISVSDLSRDLPVRDSTTAGYLRPRSG